METQKLSISVENLAPQNGGSLAPLWFGFHNGQFQAFQVGGKASAGVEQLAEDGSPAGVITEFTAAAQGTVQGAIRGSTGGPFLPNDVIRTTVTIDPKALTSRYFSYASMILPSNDQFIANADPRDVQVFSANGRFLGAEFTVDAREAWDSGTEINDEIPANTAFFGQSVPNTGVVENSVVKQGTGYKPKGSGGVLDAPRFSNADFLAPGYQFVHIRVANLIEGGAGNDTLFGTEAPDDIFAGDGNNTVYGNGGNDRITSGRGNDKIFAGLGNDVIQAGDGNNKIYGNGGNDRITTGSGNDRIFAGSGNDIISTGVGNDVIFANGGNDVIDTGTGNDQVYAGSGSDRFILNAGGGQVRIYNYDKSDRFSLGAGLSNLNSITTQIQGSDTILRQGNDVLAILQGVQTAQVGFV